MHFKSDASPNGPKFLPHLVSFINAEGKMREREMKIWKWSFDESSSPALRQHWTDIPTWLSAILLVYSLSMRSGHRSLWARIAADSSRSTASVSASAQDYKSILHTCNLRGHAAPETENERGKKKKRGRTAWGLQAHWSEYRWGKCSR